MRGAKQALCARLARDSRYIVRALARRARRPLKRGDVARARTLAQMVVDRWRFADEDVPTVGEMRALLAKMPP
jgi:hypothetical protein